MPAVFCWAVGEQDLPLSHSASQDPSSSFMLVDSYQCLRGQSRHPMENVWMNCTAKKKSEAFLNIQRSYQLQNSYLPPTAPSSLGALCEGTGDLGKKKPVMRSYHYHISIPVLSHCLQLSLFYSCTWLLRLWSSPSLHILWCILAYIVCNLTPCHLIPPTSHNPYQPLSPLFHLSFV